jgi:hypothetical protein
MFQDNPLTGILFLAAISWGALAASVPQVLFAGVLGVVASTLTAIWLKADQAALRAGLYGYNGVLVGLALATFIAPGAALWIYVALGAAVSTVATLGTASVLKRFGTPALTAPLLRSHGSCCSRLTASRASRALGCQPRGSWPPSSQRRPSRWGSEPILWARSYRSRRCF